VSWPYDADWRRFRTLILARDNRQCQIRGNRCTRHATEVDHITPLAVGGARLDPTNARAACKPCNSQLGAILGNRLREPHTVNW
jgi:5-methylcytosine-specific restriction endonuclease McrA